MAEIIKGTTPTISYTFDTVSVSNITAAVLTLSQDDDIILEKSLSDATVGDDSLSWSFSQEETLAINGSAVSMLNWKTSDGKRGASKRTKISFIENVLNEVI